MIIKRLLDIFISLFVLTFFSPFIFVFGLLIWLQDFNSPFYLSYRVGIHSRPFLMFKLRSMIVNADSTGISSTSGTDCRITPIGKLVRKFKLDELTQFVNVLKGDMSVVGPRPNVQSEVDLYSEEELYLLSVKPGITDISSIVFSDESKILEPFGDPDLAYNQYVRPYKSRLGLLYIDNSSFSLDLSIIIATFLGIFSRRLSLNFAYHLSKSMGCSDFLLSVVRRNKPLAPLPPPGLDNIVTSHSSSIQ